MRACSGCVPAEVTVRPLVIIFAFEAGQHVRKFSLPRIYFLLLLRRQTPGCIPVVRVWMLSVQPCYGEAVRGVAEVLIDRAVVNSHCPGNLVDGFSCRGQLEGLLETIFLFSFCLRSSSFFLRYNSLRAVLALTICLSSFAVPDIIAWASSRNAATDFTQSCP